MTAAQDCADNRERTEKAEPTESNDANEPTEPTDNADPTDPMDKTEPRDPIDRTESWDHRDHRDDDMTSSWRIEARALRRTRKRRHREPAERGQIVAALLDQDRGPERPDQAACGAVARLGDAQRALRVGRRRVQAERHHDRVGRQGPRLVAQGGHAGEPAVVPGSRRQRQVAVAALAVAATAFRGVTGVVREPARARIDVQRAVPDVGPLI